MPLGRERFRLKVYPYKDILFDIEGFLLFQVIGWGIDVP
jgi:hypothetical protein